MHKLTLITLENGECALYLDQVFVECDDADKPALSLHEITETLAAAMKVDIYHVEAAYPLEDDWCWNDIADHVFSAQEKTDD